MTEKISNQDDTFLNYTRKILKEYYNDYEARRKQYFDDIGHRSSFESGVYIYMNKLVNIEFIKEKQLRATVCKKSIETINTRGQIERIDIDWRFSFDGYIELNKDQRSYLGLDKRWRGIAWEAQGEYYHNLPRQIEADRKKRLICKKENIILLEIWENWEKKIWETKILNQFKEQTGLEINHEHLSGLGFVKNP